MKRRDWNAAVIALIGAAALAISACGSDDDGGSGDSGSGDGGGTLGVSLPTVEGPFFSAMVYGMEEEAEALGYELDVQDAGGYPNVDEQVSQFENLGVQQVDAILVDPADPTALEGAVSAAIADGTPVIGAGDPMPGADSSVSSSHCDIGKEMATGAQDLLPDGGTIAVLAGPPGATWSTERLNCFKEDTAGTGIKVVAEQFSEPAVDEGVALASDFLQRFPSVDVLYGADDTVGVGAAKAVQENNKCEQTDVLIAVLGVQAERLLNEGCIDYIVAQQTVKVGREAVRTADALINGEEVEENIVIELIPVTRKNLADVDLTTIREPEGFSPG